MSERYFGEGNDDSDEELKMPSLVQRELREENEEEEEFSRQALKRIEELATQMMRDAYEEEIKKKENLRKRMYRIVDYMHELGGAAETESDEPLDEHLETEPK
jgi:hypothetical protein